MNSINLKLVLIIMSRTRKNFA